MYVYCFQIKLKQQTFQSIEVHLSMNKHSEVMVVDNYEYINSNLLDFTILSNSFIIDIVNYPLMSYQYQN